jgi:succinyl-CoA synthetase beta subunit
MGSFMNIHEYQAKELLAKYGIGIPTGHAAMTVEEAVAGAEALPGPLYVVKAQIHAGGRGKGKFKELGADAKGGVRLAKSIDDVRKDAGEMLGNTLVTVQTGIGILPFDAGRPQERPRCHDRLDRRRYGHRNRGA